MTELTHTSRLALSNYATLVRYSTGAIISFLSTLSRYCFRRSDQLVHTSIKPYAWLPTQGCTDSSSLRGQFIFSWLGLPYRKAHLTEKWPTFPLVQQTFITALSRFTLSPTFSWWPFPVSLVLCVWQWFGTERLLLSSRCAFRITTPPKSVSIPSTSITFHQRDTFLSRWTVLWNVVLIT